VHLYEVELVNLQVVNVQLQVTGKYIEKTSRLLLKPSSCVSSPDWPYLELADTMTLLLITGDTYRSLLVIIGLYDHMGS
jgi:hypothetical protein